MKKSINALLAICLAAVLSITFVCVALPLRGNHSVTPTEPEAPPLSFDAEGNFKILHLADFHEWCGVEDGSKITVKDTLKPRLVAYIDKFITDEQPDLVVLGGDNVFSLSFLKDLGDGISSQTYRLIAEVFEERCQYWTMTFGNHDSESAKSKQDFIKIVSQYKYFIGGEQDGKWYRSYTLKATNGEADYVGNFSVPIYSADGQKVAHNLFVLDSGSNNAPGGSYHVIQRGQVDWYISEAARLKAENGAMVPSMIFTHIPILEVMEGYNQGGLHTGSWYGFSPADERSDIFEAAMETGDVRAFFFGHNHGTSITCFYTRGERKIALGITPSCQASSYTDTDNLMRGRVIELKEDSSFLTRIVSSENTSESAESFSYQA